MYFSFQRPFDCFSFCILISFFLFPSIPFCLSSSTSREVSITCCVSILYLPSSTIPRSSPPPMQSASRCASITSLIPPSACIFPPCCQVYMVYVCLSVCALTFSVYSLLSVSSTLCCAPPLSFTLPPIPPSVHPLSGISSMWLVFTPSQLHFPLQESTVRERERGSNRHCLLDPSNHGLHIVIMWKTLDLYLLGSGTSSQRMHWKACCPLE